MDFLKKAKSIVVDYFNQRVEKTEVSTTVSDGMYYELTYNGDKKETYLDAYKKWENIPIKDGEKL